MSDPISFNAPELAPELHTEASTTPAPVKDKPKPSRRTTTQWKPFRWL